MSAVLADARKVAMSLSDDDRFVLAHELLLSLDEQTEFISNKEMDRRLVEMRSGTAASVSLQESEQSMQEALDGMPAAFQHTSRRPAYWKRRMK